MENITEINDRHIKFEEFDTSKNWIADFPYESWCLIIIAEQENRKYFDEIIRKALDRNVGYIIGVGKQHELIHNMADDEIVIREVENLYLPKHVILTVGEEDFENGIWDGIFASYNEEAGGIKELVILDVTKKAFEKTVSLLKKIETGYIPKD